MVGSIVFEQAVVHLKGFSGVEGGTLAIYLLQIGLLAFLMGEILLTSNLVVHRLSIFRDYQTSCESMLREGNWEASSTIQLVTPRCALCAKF